MGDEATPREMSLQSWNSSYSIDAEGHLHWLSDAQPADRLATVLRPVAGPSASSGHFLPALGLV
jgi:hypothetical protein